jgi:hypothetical protein
MVLSSLKGSAITCGDDRLAGGKAEAHAFTFVVKNASKILLRSENGFQLPLDGP